MITWSQVIYRVIYHTAGGAVGERSEVIRHIAVSLVPAIEIGCHLVAYPRR